MVRHGWFRQIGHGAVGTGMVRSGVLRHGRKGVDGTGLEGFSRDC